MISLFFVCILPLARPLLLHFSRACPKMTKPSKKKLAVVAPQFLASKTPAAIDRRPLALYSDLCGSSEAFLVFLQVLVILRILDLCISCLEENAVPNVYIYIYIYIYIRVYFA